jgi:hypothetical protein
MNGAQNILLPEIYNQPLFIKIIIFRSINAFLKVFAYQINNINSLWKV